MVDDIVTIILDIKEVLAINDLKTRQSGGKLYVDVEVTLDSQLSFAHAHEVAHLIHTTVAHKSTRVKHCMVHVNPSMEERAHTEVDTHIDIISHI